MFVYCFGDIKQLPLVRDGPLYNKTWGQLPIYSDGTLLFQQIDKYVFLNTSYRQYGIEQKVFRDILERISNGAVLIDDWKLLMTRFKNLFSKQYRSTFKNALRLFAKKKEVEQYNQNKLKKFNMPVAKIEAIHNCEEAKMGSQQMANRLINLLYLSIGSRVMLKSNLWTDKGLVNGALGYVRKIIYQLELHPPDNAPDVLMIEFDHFLGTTFENLVSIP